MKKQNGAGFDNRVDIGSCRDAKLCDKGTDTYYNQLGSSLYMTAVN